MFGADAVCDHRIVQRLFLPNQCRFPFFGAMSTHHFHGPPPDALSLSGYCIREAKRKSLLGGWVTAASRPKFLGEDLRRATGPSGSGKRSMYPTGYTGSSERIRVSGSPKEHGRRRVHHGACDGRGRPLVVVGVPYDSGFVSVFAPPRDVSKCETGERRVDIAH
jgi:hypothetical protein